MSRRSGRDHEINVETGGKQTAGNTHNQISEGIRARVEEGEWRMEERQEEEAI
jgi:hypothetical protein